MNLLIAALALSQYMISKLCTGGNTLHLLQRDNAITVFAINNKPIWPQSFLSYLNRDVIWALWCLQSTTLTRSFNNLFQWASKRTSKLRMNSSLLGELSSQPFPYHGVFFMMNHTFHEYITDNRTPHGAQFLSLIQLTNIHVKSKTDLINTIWRQFLTFAMTVFILNLGTDLFLTISGYWVQPGIVNDIYKLTIMLTLTLTMKWCPLWSNQRFREYITDSRTHHSALSLAYSGMLKSIPWHSCWCPFSMHCQVMATFVLSVPDSTNLCFARGLIPPVSQKCQKMKKKYI